MGRATVGEFQGLPDPPGLPAPLDPRASRDLRGLLGRKGLKAKQVRLGRRGIRDLKVTLALQERTGLRHWSKLTMSLPVIIALMVESR
jgi:hypothetical protein